MFSQFAREENRPPAVGPEKSAAMADAPTPAHSLCRNLPGVVNFALRRKSPPGRPAPLNPSTHNFAQRYR